jgi:ribonuclease BN (tRNA processing enzyme)
VEITVLGCYGGESHGQHSSGFLIDGRTLLEAGSVTSVLPEDSQRAITHVVVSHAHLDHTKELLFLTDNRNLHGGPKLRVTGIPEVIEQLRTHLFNDQIWPDFTRRPSGTDPVLILEELAEGKENRMNDLAFIPVRVNHTVPASGFIIRGAGSSVVYSGDTGPTEELWNRARAIPDLKAVIIEASFPDEMRKLAFESGHLTPALVAGELAKLARPEVPVFAAHLKPAFVEQVTRQLAALDGWHVLPLVQGDTYSF